MAKWDKQPCRSCHLKHESATIYRHQASTAVKSYDDEKAHSTPRQTMLEATFSDMRIMHEDR